MTEPPVHLLKGDDDVLREQAVVALVDRLVGDGDRSLLVEELAGPDYEIGAAVDAAQTPPFLTDHRVVVVRHLNRVAKADGLSSIIDYLADPLPSTRLVLVWEKTPDGRGASMRSVPAALTKAVQAAGGEVLDTSAPRGKGFGDWVDQHLADAGLRLDIGASTGGPSGTSSSGSATTPAHSSVSSPASRACSARAPRSAARTSHRSSARPAACRRGS